MPTIARKAGSAKAKSTTKRGAKNSPRLSVASKKQDREKIHPKIRTSIHAGKSALTADTCKKLLGWQEEPEDADWGVDFLLRANNVKIRCTNNLGNRPLYRANVESIRQDILRGQWRLNGETIIIGETGMVLNGQHTLVAMVLADLAYQECPELYEDLEGPPRIEKIIVYGVSEADDVVNTLDTCKPRRLTDILFRSAVFQELPRPIQKRAAALAASASDDLWRELWKKSGLVGGRERPTIPEKVEFLSCHPRLIECVLHVLETDAGEDLLKRFFPRLQVVVRLLYLLANSEEDPTAYYEAFPLGEDKINFSTFEKAKAFITAIASGEKSVSGLVNARRALAEDLQAPVQISEMIAMTISAWHLYSEGSKVTEKGVYPEMEKIDGVMQLVESPLAGGIHMGEDGYLPADPTESEVAKRKERLRKPGSKPKKGEPSVEAKRAGKGWGIGDTAWVLAEEGAVPFLGKITSLYPGPKDSQYVVIEDNDGDLSEHNTNCLNLEKPE